MPKLNFDDLPDAGFDDLPDADAAPSQEAPPEEGAIDSAVGAVRDALANPSGVNPSLELAKSAWRFQKGAMGVAARLPLNFVDLVRKGTNFVTGTKDPVSDQAFEDARSALTPASDAVSNLDTAGGELAGSIALSMAAPAPGVGGGLVKTIGKHALNAAAQEALLTGKVDGGTLAAATLGGAAGALAKSAAPFASGAKRIKGAERLGIELPASAKTTSPVAQQLEALAGKGAMGQKIVDRAMKAEQALDDAAFALEMDMTPGGIASRSDVGQQVNSALKNARAALEAKKTAAYDALGDLTPFASEEGPVHYYEAMRTARQNLGRSIGPRSPLVKRLDRWMRQVEITDETGQVIGLRPVDAEQLKQTRTQLNELANHGQAGKVTGSPAHIRSLAAAVEKDIQAALPPHMQDAWNTANAANRQMLEKVNSTWAKNISRLAKDSGGRWDKIADLVSNADAATVQHMNTVLADSPETLAAIKASTISDMLGKVRGGREGLRGERLLAIVRDREDALKSLLTRDEFMRLNDIAETAAALQRGGRLAAGSPTGYLVRMLGYGRLALTNPLMLARFVMGEMATNAFLGSEVGQRWLTTGLPMFQKAVRETGRLGVAGLSTAVNRSNEEEKLRARLERQASESI